MKHRRLVPTVACLGFLLVTPASAQSARLPIAEGVWVKTDADCSKTTNVFVYRANRFGSLYFYGPNQSMGPADETEALTHVGRGQNGFTVVNEGPLEVISRPNGQAQVRAFSPVQGVTWVETVRLCAPPTLLPRLQQALVRLRLLP